MMGLFVVNFGIIGVEGDFEVFLMYIMFELIILYCILVVVYVEGIDYVVMEVSLYGLV